MNTEDLMKNGPIIFRAALYFLVASIPAFLEMIKPYGENGATFPNLFKILYIIGATVLPGLVALRAFYDGAAQRHQDKKENGNGDTTIIKKQ